MGCYSNQHLPILVYKSTIPGVENNNPATARKGLLLNGRGKSVTFEAFWGGLGLPSQFFLYLIRLFIRLTSI